MITDTDLQGAYIAVAADVPTSTSSFTVVIGTGETFTYNNRDYTDRIVTRGTSYYFFVRLYSSAVSNLLYEELFCHANVQCNYSMWALIQLSISMLTYVICLIQDPSLFNDSTPVLPATSKYLGSM